MKEKKIVGFFHSHCSAIAIDKTQSFIVYKLVFIKKNNTQIERCEIPYIKINANV